MLSTLWQRLLDILIFAAVTYVAYHACSVLGYVATAFAGNSATAEQQYFESRMWQPFVLVMSVIVAYGAGFIGMLTIKRSWRLPVGALFGPLAITAIHEHWPDPILIGSLLVPALLVAWWTAPNRSEGSWMTSRKKT